MSEKFEREELQEEIDQLRTELANLVLYVQELRDELCRSSMHRLPTYDTGI